MKLHLISVGQRLPDWAETACSDYLKRFPRAQPIMLHEIKAEPRTGNRTALQIMEAEAVRIESVLNNPEFSSGGYQRLIWLR